MNREEKYLIVDEEGKIYARFRTKIAANQNIPRLRLTKKEELKVIEEIKIEDGI